MRGTTESGISAAALASDRSSNVHLCPVAGTMADPAVDLIQHPWSTYSELEHVYRLIYEQEDDICSLKSAQDYLTAWSLVERGTPYRATKMYVMEIRATSAFVKAALCDKMQTDEVTLQSLYSTAIITFCQVLQNYEFNMAQNKVRRITFVKTGDNRFELAESLGLAGWVVDIRNEVAHGNRVSLDLLRKATFLAMDWLSVNFWTVIMDEKRIDRRVDAIIEHIFSNSEAMDSSAKADLWDLVRGTPHSAIKFIVRSLLKATAFSDLTLHQVDNKKALIIEVIANCGYIHLMLHNLIDHFEHENGEQRSAAILWFADIMNGITTKSSLLFPRLSKYSRAENCSIPAIEVHFMKILNHLMATPCEAALSHLPCFKMIIPDKSDMIDRLSVAMSSLLGVGLTDREAVGKDYTFKTIEDVTNVSTNGETIPERSPSKRLRRC